MVVHWQTPFTNQWRMVVNHDIFMSSLLVFYDKWMPFALFILCYLLFKHSPKKGVYLHLFVVMVMVTTKHYPRMFMLMDQTYLDLDGNVLNNTLLMEYFLQGLLSSICCLFIVALMHRPFNMSYDTLLKKEIWGVWYQENNSTDYFERKK